MLMTDALSSQKPLVPNTLNTRSNLALRPSSEPAAASPDLSAGKTRVTLAIQALTPPKVPRPADQDGELSSTAARGEGRGGVVGRGREGEATMTATRKTEESIMTSSDARRETLREF